MAAADRSADVIGHCRVGAGVDAGVAGADDAAEIGDVGRSGRGLDAVDAADDGGRRAVDDRGAAERDAIIGSGHRVAGAAEDVDGDIGFNTGAVPDAEPVGVAGACAALVQGGTGAIGCHIIADHRRTGGFCGPARQNCQRHHQRQPPSNSCDRVSPAARSVQPPQHAPPRLCCSLVELLANLQRCKHAYHSQP